jgi:MFS family permease
MSRCRPSSARFTPRCRALQWTVDAYTLVLASPLMLAGATADRLGRRRVFQAGLVLVSLGSLLCALAPNLQLLVAFRVPRGRTNAAERPFTSRPLESTRRSLPANRVVGSQPCSEG